MKGKPEDPTRTTDAPGGPGPREGAAGAAGRELPGVSETLAEQLRLVTRARWKELAVLAALIAGLFGIVGWGMVEADEPDASILLMMLTGGFNLVLLTAAFWPASVWYEEGPSERTYHWSMPVSRSRHQLARVSAGAAWLLAGVALFLGVAALLLLAWRSTLPGGMPGAAFWVNYLTGPLTAYLLGSVAALLAEHPPRWIIGVPVVWFLAASLGQLLWPDGAVTRAITSVVTAAYGLGSALGGAVSREALHVMGADPGRLPAPEEWLVAAPLWLAVGVAAVVFAARVHRDA